MTATATVYWVCRPRDRSQPVLPAQVPPDAWPGLVGVGVAATFIAIQTFYAGARRVGAAHASLISHRRADLDDRPGRDPVPWP